MITAQKPHLCITQTKANVTSFAAIVMVMKYRQEKEMLLAETMPCFHSQKEQTDVILDLLVNHTAFSKTHPTQIG